MGLLLAPLGSNLSNFENNNKKKTLNKIQKIAKIPKNKKIRLLKSPKKSKIPKEIIFFLSFYSKTHKIQTKNSNIRTTQFDQSSPVHQVSESRGGSPLGVMEGRTNLERKSSCLI